MTSLRNQCLPRMQPPSPMAVNLSEVERKLCALLEDCTQHLKTEQGITTSCRIAGGWVRDKLLGSESHDIDVALEDMMGVPFAEAFVKLAAEQSGIEAKPVTTVKSNPDQSKHLETAKTSLLGIELDFVNLRSEEYTEDSRIPTAIKFGTPLQDALRRDITINALFYNVHTRAVEDHTGKGLDDMRDGVVRTPLTPNETFRDDPLRVLRCIRFASRFGFELVPELAEAARDLEIQAALAEKISRERVGEEVDKMMKGRDPLGAVHLIESLSLSHSIFAVPPSISTTFSTPLPPFSASVSAAVLLQAVFSGTLPVPLHPILAPPAPADRARLFLAAASTHYHGITYKDAKGKIHPAVEAALREGLKLGSQNHYLDGIPALFAAADLLHEPRLDSERLIKPSQRVAIGLLLREKAVHNPHTGSHWTTSILFSLVQDLIPAYDVSTNTLDDQKATAIIEIYNAFLTRIDELSLASTADAKPILDGRDIVNALEARPGPWTGRVMARVVEWQLEHPEGKKEECIAWLMAERDAGRVVVEEAGAGAGAGEKRTKNGGGSEKRPKY